MAFCAPHPIDGDTVIVCREHIRIAAIDAPEMPGHCAGARVHAGRSVCGEAGADPHSCVGPGGDRAVRVRPLRPHAGDAVGQRSRRGHGDGRRRICRVALPRLLTPCYRAGHDDSPSRPRSRARPVRSPASRPHRRIAATPRRAAIAATCLNTARHRNAAALTARCTKWATTAARRTFRRAVEPGGAA